MKDKIEVQNFKSGDKVSWYSSHTEKVGIYLGIIPVGKSPLKLFPDILNGLSTSQNKFGGGVDGPSVNERALVRVDRQRSNGQALAPYFFGARLSLLKKVEEESEEVEDDDPLTDGLPSYMTEPDLPTPNDSHSYALGLD